MIRSTIAAALAASFCLTAASAHAETRTVSFKDLNLATPEGKAELDRRIDRAARSICEIPATTGSRIPDTAAERECLTQTRHSVSTQVAQLIERKAQQGG